MLCSNIKEYQLKTNYDLIEVHFFSLKDKKKRVSTI
jgi:hypothetical protein